MWRELGDHLLQRICPRYLMFWTRMSCDVLTFFIICDSGEMNFERRSMVIQSRRDVISDILFMQSSLPVRSYRRDFKVWTVVPEPRGGRGGMSGVLTYSI